MIARPVLRSSPPGKVEVKVKVENGASSPQPQPQPESGDMAKDGE
jgi:hypothetical protein